MLNNNQNLCVIANTFILLTVLRGLLSVTGGIRQAIGGLSSYTADIVCEWNQMIPLVVVVLV